MAQLNADVVVIGGGATGVGVVRDLAMRGFTAILLERADLAQGTTGRFHGLLHSGGRYIISDPESARECAAENEIMRRIHADAVEETGGLFVVTPADSEEYADRFLAGAAAAHVPASEIPVSQALRREPRLNPGIKRAFTVRDATIDGWRMVWGAAHSAQEYGAQVLPYHTVTAIHTGSAGAGLGADASLSAGTDVGAGASVSVAADGGVSAAANAAATDRAGRKVRQAGQAGEALGDAPALAAASDTITGVTAVNEKTGRTIHIECRAVVNAAGPWAGQVAALAGAHGVEVVPGRGIMVAMNHRLVNTVINRCVYPANGDILVPAHTVSIIGTTDEAAASADFLEIKPQEVQEMLDAGEQLVPGFRQARALHAWAGARPLVRDKRVSTADTRHMSRGMAIIDHRERDGIAGLVTVVGGKLTTYRLMAQRAVDELCRQLGERRPSRTAVEAVPEMRTAAMQAPASARRVTDAAGQARTHQVSDRLAQAEATREREQLICECEAVTRAAIEALLAKQPEANFDDLRRQLRIGMGPCQGTFCAPRVAGILQEVRGNSASTKGRDADASSMDMSGPNAGGGDAGRTDADNRNMSSGDTGGADSGSPDVTSPNAALQLFIRNRFAGIAPVCYGAQLRETVLNQWVLQGTLGLSQLPPASPAEIRATGDLALLHGTHDQPPALADAQAAWTAANVSANNAHTRQGETA